jgi:hypothetical protein
VPPPRPPAIHLRSQHGFLGQALTWIAILMGVVLLALLSIAVLRRLREKPVELEPGEDGAGPEAPPLPTVEELEDEATRLAKAGRYGEAVHVLLLQAIRQLGSETPPPDSRTSRELLRQFTLAGAAREAFAGLVAAVERNLFGGEVVGREQYEACVARVRVLGGDR